MIQTDFPAPGGEPDDRNRFVLVHDTVPGGTGYLPRLADPERLREILTRAVELISTCECQTRGQPGCHRCLFTAVGRHEIPLVSRDVALQLLDEILTGWDLKPAEDGTITGVNLSNVRQSELERMFKALLHRWSTDGPARVTARPDPDHASLARFDVRFQDGPHWELREQVNLAAHGTKPDFYATRVDATGSAPVAIYLDGWEFHGSDPDQVDKDSTRRASVRAGGTRVWALTWHDVKATLTAVSQGLTVGSATPLPNPVLHSSAQGAKQAFGASHPAFSAHSLGAFDQLVHYLAHPDDQAWRALALTTSLAPGNGHTLPVDDIGRAVDELAFGDVVQPSDHETGIAAVTWTSQSGQHGGSILERGRAQILTAIVSHDTSIEPDKARWTDWLHLGNILQFLDENAVITTTRTYSHTESASTGPVPSTQFSSSDEDLLADVFDAAAIVLAEHAIDAGWSDFEVAFPAGDADDTPIEVAWPASKVGILPSNVARPTTLLEWDLRSPAGWTQESLVETLEQGVR